MSSLSRIAAALGVAAVTVLAATPALAHERQTFRVGDRTLLFVVGSLGEPVYVDDKSGVELRVKVADPSDPGNASAPKAVPVTGLEKALKVELSADGQKKVLDLAAAYNDPGAYKAVFFPTAPTTLSYRFFGTIDGHDFDTTFTCAAAGHAMGSHTDHPGHNEPGMIHEGGFGCPKAKEDVQFPAVGAPAADEKRDAGLAPGTIVFALSLVAVAFAFMVRGRRA
jgi:hypothetical protein